MISVSDKLCVAAIVVNYNGGQHIGRCLISLAAQSRQPDLVIVVDNNSQDGSQDRMCTQFPQHTYIKNSTNLGFAEGNNQALEVCCAQGMDYVALLNPDAFPEPGWLGELLDLAQSDPALGSVASRMMSDQHTGIVDGLGDSYHMFGVPGRRGHGSLFGEQWMVDTEVFGACAGAALYRMDALNKVGYFDAGFFCYLEDVDLAYRLQLAGFKSMYSARAVVTHIGSAITGYRSDFSVYYGQRNIIWAFIKNTPGPLLVLLLPGHILVNLYALGLGIYRGQFSVVLRAKWDALKGLKGLWAKRGAVQQTRTRSIVQIWRILGKSLFSRY
ncbi:MAG: glycosyltransferase family 2 protein [Pseudomonadales bacterium]|nr:glycosyltransferase family 2 protein [Pseudomonadales bacterium]